MEHEHVYTPTRHVEVYYECLSPILPVGLDLIKVDRIAFAARVFCCVVKLFYKIKGHHQLSCSG